jgi:tripartite-type tricarboxylate transporter receptor subunit TctC
LDTVFIPLLGRAGYYIFELVVPVIALASTYYAVVLAYREGLKDAAEL